MPKIRRFSPDELDAIRKLSSRQAADQFKVGFHLWRRIRHDPTFVPTRNVDPRASTELAQVVFDGVKEAPHLSAARLAGKLGLRTESVQAILRGAGLNKLHARLQYAGYQVEAVRPLAVARLRRVLAAYPGSLTHQDYKTFGYLRGEYGAPSVRVGGYACIDSLTGYASVSLASKPTADEAVAALKKHCKRSPFPIRGLVLTDNGGDFLSEEYTSFVIRELKCYHRTTRVNHPWSNGKVEALNKTLKYNCFPALGFAAGKSLDTVQEAVDAWMEWYNRNRAHTGWVNQGLPPLVFYELWKKTPGDEAEKLLNLGLLRLDGEWTLRTMGGGPGNAGERPGERRPKGQDATDGGLPFAFVMERAEVARWTDPTELKSLAAAQASRERAPFVHAK